MGDRSRRNTYKRTLLLGGGLALLAGFFWWRKRISNETLQRRVWDTLYDRLATLYDAVDWFTGNATHRLRVQGLDALPPHGAKLLEIGFGSGRLHAELAEQYSMAGLDRAPGMIKLTQSRLREKGLTSDLHQGDVTALPWKSDTFDVVFSTFATSAFPDLAAALDEMARVTKPGGRILIVDAGIPADGNFMARVLAWLWELAGDYIRDEVPILQALGFHTTRRDYGPWGCVHVTVGIKKGSPPLKC